MNPKADILIVTVTEVESRAVMQVFREATQKAPQPVPIGDRIYHDLGEINGARVFMALSEMGAGGPGASQQAVQKGINALRPSAVIMVGIAFGINENKQAIGDILVSQQLWLYDLQRIGEDKIIPRGDKLTSSTWLINHLKSANLYWEGAKVRFGLVLTGEKLVDSVDYRDQLKQFEPEAIGGEMEGAGLYVACQDRKVDWILVKGICDWANGNKGGPEKDAHQKTAARNAAGFVLHALQQARLKQERELLPHLERLTAPSAAEPGKAAHSSLPHQPYFFGREKELQVIAEAISPEARTWGALVDGPGGIGKTALAIRAGHLAPVAHFPLKFFLSAKVRELTPAGEQPLQDFMLPNYMALLAELARELGEAKIAESDPNERANAVRRALADKHALIIIDNVETFAETERVRLYQFLTRLPTSCKAIVTSRRRTDIDARVVRLDRLERKDALDLLAELAKSNRHLHKATEPERHSLYEITHGNPLLIKWVVAQLGRPGSHCITIITACAFLKAAPPDNDPLEYIFGDLLDTFTESEMAVLAALTHFSQPAKVEWIAEIASLASAVALTALEDLADRALLVSDEEGQKFFLPTLAATFLRRKRPEAIAQTGDRLTDRAYALALGNGYDEYERFPTLEAEWSVIAAAMPMFLQGDSLRLQKLFDALKTFLHFSGRWDERIALSLQAEEKAFDAHDFHKAGWRAYQAGWVYYLRGQTTEVLLSAERCQGHWQQANVGVGEKAPAIHLRGLGHLLEKDYSAAKEAMKEVLSLERATNAESNEIVRGLIELACVEQLSGDYDIALRHYGEALRLAKKNNYHEGLAHCTGSLAELTLECEDWAAAISLAREALALSEEIGRQDLIAHDCRVLAKCLARQDKPKEGIPYARRAVEICAILRLPELEKAQAVLKECEG